MISFDKDLKRSLISSDRGTYQIGVGIGQVIHIVSFNIGEKTVDFRLLEPIRDPSFSQYEPSIAVFDYFLTCFLLSSYSA